MGQRAKRRQAGLTNRILPQITSSGIRLSIVKLPNEPIWRSDFGAVNQKLAPCRTHFNSQNEPIFRRFALRPSPRSAFSAPSSAFDQIRLNPASKIYFLFRRMIPTNNLAFRSETAIFHPRRLCTTQSSNCLQSNGFIANCLTETG